MGEVKRFEDLICWKRARVLVREVYKLTANGQFSRDFELKNQIRRAAISVMNNIAEGFGRFSRKEFIRFLEMSLTSALEVKSILYIVQDLEYSKEEETIALRSLADEVKALNLGLIKYLNGRIQRESHSNT